MSGWKRSKIEGLAIYKAQTISWLPRVVQGFTTRSGGVSPKPLDSLNMSFDVGDDFQNVAENRRRATIALGCEDLRVVSARQVHGDRIVSVGFADPDIVGDADALITDSPDIMLLMLFADCVPIFFCDPIRRVVGLAHSGWQGVSSNIAGKTLARLLSDFECEAGSVFAAIGPSIGSDRYEVGLDVVAALTEAWPGGSSSPITPQNEFTNKFLVDLRLIVFDQLVSAGIRPERIAVCDECTWTNRRDFFSHRRDGTRGIATGRMAGLIGMRDLL